MFVFKKTNTKYLCQIILVLTISSITMTSFNSLYTLNYDFEAVQSSRKEGMPYIESMEQKNVSSTIVNTPNSDDVKRRIPSIGESINLTLQPFPGENYLIGNYSGILNTSSYDLLFAFQANESLLANVKLDVTFTPEGEYSFIYFEVYSGDLLEYIDGAYDIIYPLELEYYTPETGNQYINVVGDPIYGTVYFDLQIILYKEGELPTSDLITTIFQPNNHDELLDVIDYLVNTSQYMDFDLGTYSLGDFDNNVLGYAKGISSSIFSLIRAGDFLASKYESYNLSASELLFIQYNEFSPYFTIANRLFDDINSTFLHPTGKLFYSPSESNPSLSEYNLTLTMNIYILMAMLEIWQFYDFGIYDVYDPILSDNFLTHINSIAIAVNQTFYNTTYDIFVEKISINDNATLNVADRGSQVCLESLGLLCEVFNRIHEANEFYYGSAPVEIESLKSMTQIVVDFIQTNMTHNYLGMTLLDSPGLGVEFFDLQTGLKSNSSTLIGQAHYLSLLTPGTLYTGYTDIVNASTVAENSLMAFLSSVDGLLYDKIYLNTTENNQLTSTINTMYFLSALNRLAEAWKEDLTFSHAKEISRTWVKAWIDLHNAFRTLLYDTETSSYFAQYRHSTETVIRNDLSLETSTFVANTFILDSLSAAFPINTIIQTSTNSYVDEKSTIFFSVEEIITLGSWSWFTPTRIFSFQVTVSSTYQGFSETLHLDVDEFNFDSGYLQFFYTPTKRGEFSIDIEISSEGEIILSKSILTKALGSIDVNYHPDDFSITTDHHELESTITFLDEEGLNIPNLVIEAKIMDNISLPAYTQVIRTDSSGKAKLDFNITSIEQHFNLSVTDFPHTLLVLLNVSNAERFNFRETTIAIPLQLHVATLNLLVNPANLEVIQASSIDYTFSVFIQNQDQKPVTSALITYYLEETQNNVTTNVDGEAKITLNVLDINPLRPPGTNITFSVFHRDYLDTNFTKPIIVLPNELRVIANPVEFTTPEKTIFDQKIPQIVVEVTAEDAFGRIIAANVSLEWENENVSSYNLKSLGKHLTPYTFTFPANLPVGSYTFDIIAEKVSLTDPDDPVIVTRTIIVTQGNIVQSFITASAVAVMGMGFFVVKVVYDNTKGSIKNIIITRQDRVASRVKKGLNKRNSK